MLKIGLVAKFEIKDLGELKHFLGMELENIFLNQRDYVLDLLNE